MKRAKSPRNPRSNGHRRRQIGMNSRVLQEISSSMEAAVMFHVKQRRHMAYRCIAAIKAGSPNPAAAATRVTPYPQSYPQRYPPLNTQVFPQPRTRPLAIPNRSLSWRNGTPPSGDRMRLSPEDASGWLSTCNHHQPGLGYTEVVRCSDPSKESLERGVSHPRNSRTVR